MTPAAELTLPDRLRRTGWLAALVMLPYVLFGRGLVLDGRAGWIYAGQRAYAEWLLAWHVLDGRWRRGGD